MRDGALGACREVIPLARRKPQPMDALGLRLGWLFAVLPLGAAVALGIWIAWWAAVALGVATLLLLLVIGYLASQVDDGWLEEKHVGRF